MARGSSKDGVDKLAHWLEDQQLSKAGLAICLDITRDRLDRVLDRHEPIIESLASRISELSPYTSEELVTELPTEKENP